jgi:hypothetical protein
MNRKLIIIGLLAVTVAFGQRGGGGGGGGRGGGGGGMVPQGNFGGKNKLELMTTMLQLDKEQKKDVKTLMDEAQKEAAPVRDGLAKSRAQLAAAIESGKKEDIDTAVAAHSEVEAKMTAIEMKAFAGIYKLLGSDQKTKSRGLFVMMPGIFHNKNWVDSE